MVLGVGSICIGLGVLGLFLAFAPLDAAAPFELRGYAWVSTGFNTDGVTPEGLGWMSMSSANPGQGATPYGVQISAAKELSGYAWIGGGTDAAYPLTNHGTWVRFDSTIGCPAGGIDSDSNCTARVISDGGTGYQLTGWARACSVFQTGCSGATKTISGSELGGWDGWISLNCENTNSCGTSNYAIRIAQNGTIAGGATGVTGSFAYGDTVLGWLDFKNVTVANLCPASTSYSCVAGGSQETTTNIWCEGTNNTTACSFGCNSGTGQCNPPLVGPPVVGAFTVTPPITRAGNTITINWSVSNAYDCTMTGFGGPWTGLTGTQTANPTNLTTYTLTCDGNEIDSVKVDVLPVVGET